MFKAVATIINIKGVLESPVPLKMAETVNSKNMGGTPVKMMRMYPNASGKMRCGAPRARRMGPARTMPKPVDNVILLEKKAPNRSCGTRSRIHEFQLQFDTALKAALTSIATTRRFRPPSFENKNGMRAMSNQKTLLPADAAILIARLFRSFSTR